MVVALFSLQFKPVQTYVAKKAATYLSKELKTKISISGLYIKPFKSVVIEGLIIHDQQNDTLLNTPRFIVDLNQLSLKQRIIDVNTVQINNGSFYLKEYKDSTSNLDFIINYFDSGAPEKKTPGKKPYKVTFDRVILNNIAFKYKNFRSTVKTTGAVNFDDINLTALNGIFEGLNTTDHIIQTNIKNLTFREKSGFYLKNLTAFTTIDSNAIELKKLLIETNQSRLTDYYQMKFKSFKDFNKYVTNVRMAASFKNSHIASRDIAYFAPELLNMKLDLDIDGEISGYVNNLRAKKLEIKAGRATYIKGNYILKGLPNLKETFMDLKIEMAGTNKKDL
ncbi:translocation/assembly module TamB, partial [bacterium]